MKKADIQRLSIDRYDYPLPDERIAKYPLPDRDGSKLLVYDAGLVTSTLFRSLPEQLPPGSLLLFNDTRVIHARLLFHKVTGARVEVFCLSPYEPADYAVSFQQRSCCSWRCMEMCIRDRSVMLNGMVWRVDPPARIVAMDARLETEILDALPRFIPAICMLLSELYRYSLWDSW